jgi:hypothetical protein
MGEFHLCATNIAAALIPWGEGDKDVPGLLLGSKSVAADNNLVSESVRLFETQVGKTDKIRKGLLVVKLTSGALTVQGRLTATSSGVDFGSPDFTTGSISNSNYSYTWFDVTAEKPVVTLKRIGGVAGAEIERAALFIFGKSPFGVLKAYDAGIGFNGLGASAGGFDFLLAE